MGVDRNYSLPREFSYFVVMEVHDGLFFEENEMIRGGGLSTPLIGRGGGDGVDSYHPLVMIIICEVTSMSTGFFNIQNIFTKGIA